MLEVNGEFVIRCELDLAILIDQMSLTIVNSPHRKIQKNAIVQATEANNWCTLLYTCLGERLSSIAKLHK